MLEQYNITHVSTRTGFDDTNRQNRLISVVIIDLFQDFNDPSHYVTYKVEHLNAKHLLQEHEFHLN